MKKQTIITLVIIAIVVALVVAIWAAVANGKKTSGEGTKVETVAQIKEMFNSIYTKLKNELPSLETQKIDVSDSTQVKEYTGLKSNENVEAIVVSEPLMSSQAYSAVAVKVKAGANIESKRC